ncbi:pol-related protein [Clonorchis sinensis]|uniref:Pol-related protein n=1 Tax=Clonorchis sinensis TaxID=79923 RepID=G7YJ48_CLOSI|nr:pol-related protein [Clonorchis sinensis]
MYPNVPKADAVEVARRLLLAATTLQELTQFSVDEIVEDIQDVNLDSDLDDILETQGYLLVSYKVYMQDNEMRPELLKIRSSEVEDLRIVRKELTYTRVRIPLKTEGPPQAWRPTASELKAAVVEARDSFINAIRGSRFVEAIDLYRIEDIQTDCTGGLFATGTIALRGTPLQYYSRLDLLNLVDSFNSIFEDKFQFELEGKGSVEDPTTISLPVNKGRMNVIMDQSDYVDKPEALLNGTITYRRLKDDQTKNLRNKINKSLKRLKALQKITTEEYRRLRARESNTNWSVAPMSLVNAGCSLQSSIVHNRCGRNGCPSNVRRGMQCHTCKAWWHFKCTGLQDDQVSQLTNSPDPFVCASCLYTKVAMHSQTKKKAIKNKTNSSLPNHTNQCKCSSLIDVLAAKLELLSKALTDANTENAAIWTKVDKELSSLNEYLALSTPGLLAAKKFIQLSYAAIKTATASLVDRRKILGRAVSVQKANPTIRRPSEDRPLDARKLGHSSSGEEGRKKLPDGTNSADHKLKAKPFVVMAPCAPESTPRQTTATPDSSFYSTTAAPSNSIGSDALEEASLTWTERPNTRDDFQVLYEAYVRPRLEHANSVVYSGCTKDVILIERVRRAATKMVAGLKSMDYETRLVVLDLFPLEYRRLRGDLILTYALFEQGLANRFFTVDPANTRRGHGERQLLNDKNKTDPGNLGKSLAPVYQSVNCFTVYIVTLVVKMRKMKMLWL